MSKTQHTKVESHEQQAHLDLNQRKVNPESTMLEQFESPHKNVDANPDQESLTEVDAHSPKRNKSEYRSNITSPKSNNHKHSLSLTYTPNMKNKHSFTNSARIPELEQESDQKNYEQLTMKLQLVLNKISSSTKVMNKSVSQSENIMARFEQCQERKRRQIDKKKEQYQQQKQKFIQYRCKELKQKPTIDKNSNKISKELGHKPIYLRVDALVEEKKKKLQKNEELKKKKQEEEESTYIQQYNKHVKKPDNIRTYDQYFSEMVRWKQKRNEENKQKLQVKKSKQLEGITFQPSLNLKSKKMVSSHPRLPIEQRGLIKNKKIAALPKPEEQKSYKKIANQP